MGTLTTAVDYAVTKGDYSSPPDVCLVPSTHLDLSRVWGGVTALDKLGLRETLKILVRIETCLRARGDVAIGEDERDAVASLCEWLSRASLPCPQFAEALESTYLGPTAASTPSPPPDYKLLNLKHTVALTCLLHLTNTGCVSLIRHIPFEISVATIVTLAAFVSIKNPWSTPQSSSLASSILLKWLSPITFGESLQWTLPGIIKTILCTHIRPLFTSNPNIRITSSGRKHHYPQPDPRWEPQTLAERPWKQKSVWAVPVLGWAINQYHTIGFKDLEEQIPLLVPPILALIDDTSIPFKAQGCYLLHQTLLHLSNNNRHSQTPPPAEVLLRKTGLDNVFFEALMSCTLYLPTLTEEPESAVLLQQSYAALLALDTVRWPKLRVPQNSKGKSPYANSKSEVERSRRLSLLRQVMSKGLIGGLHHIRVEYPRVSHVLITTMMPILDALGIEAARYLQEIIPLLNTHLAHPFATSSPSVLVATLKTYQTLIRVCSPRLDAHYVKMLEGLCVCWYQMHNYGSEFQAGGVNELLRNFVQSLRDLLKGRLPNGTFDEETTRLQKDNKWLAGLFADIPITS